MKARLSSVCTDVNLACFSWTFLQPLFLCFIDIAALAQKDQKADKSHLFL